MGSASKGVAFATDFREVVAVARLLQELETCKSQEVVQRDEALEELRVSNEKTLKGLLNSLNDTAELVEENNKLKVGVNNEMTPEETKKAAATGKQTWHLGSTLTEIESAQRTIGRLKSERSVEQAAEAEARVPL